MKRIKKFISVMMVLSMVLAMAIPVAATGTDGSAGYSITIAESNTGYVYDAYQIFKGTYLKEGDKASLGNIEWGDNVNVTSANDKFNNKSAAEVAAELADGATANGDDTPAAKQFAEDIAGCLTGDPKASASAPTNGKYVLSGLSAGYYLVQNSQVPANTTYTRYILEVVGNVEAQPKTGTLEHDKYIEDKAPDGQEGVDYYKANNAPIGQVVKYNIPVQLPENLDAYKSYYLSFEDTMSKGLSINLATIKVQAIASDVTEGKNVGNSADLKAVMGTISSNPTKAADVTRYFWKPTTENDLQKDANGNTSISVNIADVKALNGVLNGDVKVGNNSWIILTYEVTLNADAVIGISGNENYVKIEYSNDPNNSGVSSNEPDEPENPPTPDTPTGETPNKDVKTFTTELAILKTDEEGDILPGVQFTLSGNGVNVSLRTEESFVEAKDGIYYLLSNNSYTLTAPIIGGDEDNTIHYTDFDKETQQITKKYNRVTNIVQTSGENESYKITGTVDARGRVVFTGLGAGKYTLTEVKESTPSGYNTIDPISFEIVFTKSNDGKSGGFSVTGTDKISVATDNILQATIINQRGSLLPSTGGIGTTIFYVIGGILVVGAAILLVTKKRMSNEA